MNAQPEHTEILIAYKGPFEMHILSDFANYIHTLSDKMNIQSRLFRVYIEMVQNVALYSVDRAYINKTDVGVGSLELEEYFDFFKVTTTNLIKKENEFNLRQYCDQIKSMNDQELRKIKSSIRKNRSSTDSGAHIGLVQVGILSSNNLYYDILSNSNQLSWFKLSVKIQKDKTYLKNR